MNTKLGVLLIGGMLVLAACGEEEAQPTGNEPVQEETDSTQEEVTQEEAVTEEDINEESAPEDDATPEEEITTEETTDAANAASGEASPLLSKGEKTSFEFNDVGEYSIYCEPHPVMKLNVMVEEGASQSGELALNIEDYAFGEDVIVAPGTVITWTNQDSAQHNVAFR